MNIDPLSYSASGVPGTAVEILAPAGSLDALAAALRAGADAVYFGVGRLNMRSRSTANFTHRDLERIVRRCHHCGVRAYLTLNTVVYDEDLAAVREDCRAAREAGVDAVIAADPAVLAAAAEEQLPVHMSVQASIGNLAAVRFYARWADVMVLARELTLPQIRTIVDGIRRESICGPSGQPVRIELFAHGALCVSVSGQCFMSLALYNASANRGACVQNCRRAYRVTDLETGMELELDRHYVMSPRDLCTIPILNRLLAAGVAIFKLEGRGRSPDYTYRVTRTYREAVDACLDGSYSETKVKRWMTELESVFNRGFWTGGYYLGEPLGEWATTGGNCATTVKRRVGRVSKYFAKLGVAEIKLEAENVTVGDQLLFTGPTTGALFSRVEEIREDDRPLTCAHGGMTVSLPVTAKVRVNDQVYLLEPRRFGDRTPSVNPASGQN